MNAALELVSIQYALALLIGQDLDLRRMLRKFLPSALKLLNSRQGHIWLNRCTNTRDNILLPCYSYPKLNAPLADKFPSLAEHLTLEQRLESQEALTADSLKLSKSGEIISADGIHYHLLPIGKTGLLVIMRETPLPQSHILALVPLLDRLETACLACLQHAYVEIARNEALEAKEVAEQASKAKSQFLAMISHEIRTPMNGIIGLTDLMRYGELLPNQRNYLDMIKSSSNALLDIINELLDFSRIEAGTLTLSVNTIELRELCKETFMPLAMRAKDKALSFHYEIADNVPNNLEADAGRLRQIMINLVGNAIKFTETGEITVSISLQSGSPPNKASLLFAVKDTGIGISNNKLEKIFQAFQQADSSISRRYGGTGLGLAISSQLIEMMGGQLQVQSELDNGSIFYFNITLPITQKAAANALQQNDKITSKYTLRILLAEDNAVNRMLAVHLLKKVGHQVLVAENGKIAVERWQADLPDVILMDMQMPIMDGLEATRCIREQERINQHGKHTPIVALTANAMQSDREKCLGIGMDAFLSKPFNAQTLLDVLDQVCAPVMN
ncbi:MAG TPA: response regulator [Thiothrix sp.]|nr:response regulator [Thiothrix sp.]